MPNEAVRETEKLMLSMASGEHLNAIVESALYNMATGYKTEEKKEIYKFGKLHETVIIQKEVEPNLNAIKLWLFNRLPNKWKEKTVDDENTLKKVDAILKELDTIINGE